MGFSSICLRISYRSLISYPSTPYSFNDFCCYTSTASIKQTFFFKNERTTLCTCYTSKWNSIHTIIGSSGFPNVCSWGCNLHEEFHQSILFTIRFNAIEQDFSHHGHILFTNLHSIRQCAYTSSYVLLICFFKNFIISLKPIKSFCWMLYPWIQPHNLTSKSVSGVILCTRSNAYSFTFEPHWLFKIFRSLRTSLIALTSDVFTCKSSYPSNETDEQTLSRSSSTKSSWSLNWRRVATYSSLISP